MAEGVKIDIVSPERLVLSEQARSVVVPGTEGYFTVLGDHAPFMTTLRTGFITVTDTANVAHVFYVRGGFADVAPGALTILAEEARPVADFDRTEIEALVAAGMTALEAARTAEEQDRLQTEIDQWKNLLLDASVGRDTAH